MPLKLYRQKRNFKKTPEPAGTQKKAGQYKNLYIIQKHAASHLHYDFRLELEGVLISWAVPKGPCLDPKIKRLAMHVEDHPVEYGSFEGIIPQGEYGGGTVMLWDRGQWLSTSDDPIAAYRKGDLTFELFGEKLKGLWKLIRINKNDKTWLLFKLKDSYAKSLSSYDITKKKPNSVLSNYTLDEITEKYSKVWGKGGLILDTKNSSQPRKKLSIPKNLLVLAKKTSFPEIILPQLATLVDIPPVGENWLHEIKLDGYRLIAFKKGKKTRLMTRNNNDWTNKFSSIAEKINQLPIVNAVLDGEVVVLDENQRPNFQLLQNSIKEQNHPFILYLFDLLYFESYDLTSLPLIDRKDLLKQLLSRSKSKELRFSDHLFGSGKDILERACELNFEGIISKNALSPYFQHRSTSWLKVKCTKRQEFVVGGYSKPGGKRSYFGSLLLGTYNKNKQLIYHGNVGTGFTEKSLKMLYDKLTKLKTDKIPFVKKPPGSKDVTWVKPKLIAEVEFTEWTNEGTLRHPSFKGLRADKNPTAITIEKEKKLKKIIENKNNFKISNPDKILYPENKVSKRNIADYYDTISNWILPYIEERPLTLVRCPENYKDCFYQKHMNELTTTALYKIPIVEKHKKEEYIYLKDKAGLMTLAQFNAIELHPWASRVDDVEYPDYLIFDLDPGPDVKWRQVVAAAFDVKDFLNSLKLKSFVKTTGGKGLHVVVPILPEFEWDQVKNFSHVFVNFLVQQKPEAYVGKMTKALRTRKIYIDYLRNQRGATAIAPYSLRARLNAPVATPIAWDELTNNIKDTFYTIKTLPKRLAELNQDPWKEFFKIKQSLNLS